MSFDQFIAQVMRILDFPLIRSGQSQLTVLGLIELVALFGIVLVGERLLRRYFIKTALARTRFEPSMQFAITRIVGYVIIVLGFYISLQVVGINLSSLTVLAGAIGVGIGFGLQNVINNFISGLIILAERPIALGDIIDVGGVTGKVARISLRSTLVITNDNISIIVPNSDFITQAVTNWSHGDPKVRFRLPLGVAYGTDTDKLRRVLLEVATQHPKVLKDPAPDVYFIGFGNSSLDFELGVWTAEMAFNLRRFRSELYFTIEKKLRDAGIEIPFPQRVVHFKTPTGYAAGESGGPMR